MDRSEYHNPDPGIQSSPVSQIQIQRLLPNIETEADDWNAPGTDVALESTEKGAHRPPPKPPNFASDGGKDLRSLAHEIGGTDPSEDDGLAASSGAEDGAVAMGKVVNVGSANLSRGSSDVVGAFSEGMWTAAGKTTIATVVDGSLRARRLGQLILLKSPPLLAAVFLWDRNKEDETVNDQEGMAILGTGTSRKGSGQGAPGTNNGWTEVVELAKEAPTENSFTRRGIVGAGLAATASGLAAKADDMLDGVVQRTERQ